MTSNEAIQTLCLMQSQHNHIRRNDAEWEAVELGKDALREKQTAPLTLKELRGMDGEPVWNHDIKEWMILYLHHPKYDDCALTRDGKWRTLDNQYYRRRPVK